MKEKLLTAGAFVLFGAGFLLAAFQSPEDRPVRPEFPVQRLDFERAIEPVQEKFEIHTAEFTSTPEDYSEPLPEQMVEAPEAPEVPADEIIRTRTTVRTVGYRARQPVRNAGRAAVRVATRPVERVGSFVRERKPLRRLLGFERRQARRQARRCGTNSFRGTSRSRTMTRGVFRARAGCPGSMCP